jgi:hypothetical protein
MTARQQIEQAGRAPVLGWCDQRRKGHPVNLTKTDIRKTWAAVQKVQEKQK